MQLLIEALRLVCALIVLGAAGNYVIQALFDPEILPRPLRCWRRACRSDIARDDKGETCWRCRTCGKVRK